jgi:hypothetical protein
MTIPNKFYQPRIGQSHQAIRTAYNTYTVYLNLRWAFLYNRATAAQVNQAKEAWERACAQVLERS